MVLPVVTVVSLSRFLLRVEERAERQQNALRDVGCVPNDGSFQSQELSGYWACSSDVPVNLSQEKRFAVVHAWTTQSLEQVTIELKWPSKGSTRTGT